MSEEHYLRLTPKLWKNEIQSARFTDEGNIGYMLSADCKIENRGSTLVTDTEETFSEYNVHISVVRKFEPHPPPFETENPKPDVMDPINGCRPFGFITSFSDLFSVALYPGEAVFDELWSRTRYGGALPSDILLTIFGVSFGEGPTEHYWNTTKNKRLPIVEYRFGFTPI